MFEVCQVDIRVTETQAVFAFKSPQKTRELLYNVDGNWTSAVDEQKFDWNPANRIAFKFILERPYDDLLKIFATAEETLGEGVLRNSFPFNDIVMMALNDSGEYWMDLALKWMTDPNFKFNDELLTRIAVLAFQRTGHQKLKHRFLRLYAKLKRDGLISKVDGGPGGIIGLEE
jgi:hypothetical protein